jgi:hypothetical protein
MAELPCRPDSTDALDDSVITAHAEENRALGRPVARQPVPYFAGDDDEAPAFWYAITRRR